jgi:hypothetical protein
MRLAAALAAVALLLPARASAYEGQWHGNAGLGYLGGWNGIGHGFGGELELAYDPKDWGQIFLAADVSHHPATKYTLPSGVLGFKLRFDVLRVVPYVGVHIGFAGATHPNANPLGYVNFGLPFGFEYFINRSLTVGLAGRFQIIGGHGNVWPMMGALARVGFVWGG